MADPSTERLSMTAGKTRLLLASAAVLWGAAVGLWLQGGFDKAVQLAHEPLRQVPLLADAARALSRYGMTFCVLIFLALLVSSLRPEGEKALHRIFLPIVLSFAAAGIVGDLSKEAFVRPRPFVAFPGEIRSIIAPGSYSLPSGHATKSFALVLPFVVFAGGRTLKRRALKGLLLLAAGAVAYSRILLGVHYLSDILAGAGTALLFLPLVTAAANGIYGRNRMGAAEMKKLAAACGFILVGMIFYLIRYS